MYTKKFPKTTQHIKLGIITEVFKKFKFYTRPRGRVVFDVFCKNSKNVRDDSIDFLKNN